MSSGQSLDAVANPDADGVVGCILPYAGEVLPSSKWRWAHGSQEISRTEFSLYYSRVGDKWGAGDGSTTVDLPDFDKKFPVGWDSAGDTAYETGDSVGSATGSVSGTTGNESSHTHGPGSYSVTVTGRVVQAGTPDQIGDDGAYAVTGTSGAGSAHSHSFSGTADTIPPARVVRFIVKIA